MDLEWISVVLGWILTVHLRWCWVWMLLDLWVDLGRSWGVRWIWGVDLGGSWVWILVDLGSAKGDLGGILVDHGGSWLWILVDLGY